MQATHKHTCKGLSCSVTARNWASGHVLSRHNCGHQLLPCRTPVQHLSHLSPLAIPETRRPTTRKHTCLSGNLYIHIYICTDLHVLLAVPLKATTEIRPLAVTIYYKSTWAQGWFSGNLRFLQGNIFGKVVIPRATPKEQDVNPNLSFDMDTG